ncbi:MAG: BrxA/BrxB family bacilliredoxin, partial [Planctomycetes bacterium]|nr:BrxA/BrxB family bacilliredoxin [Planctomycetota bacterium]
MGAFHDGKGDLHGITVVVETRGPRLCVGRCDEVTGEAVILLAATARARSYFADIPPSSPSAALLREGQVVAFVP